MKNILSKALFISASFLLVTSSASAMTCTNLTRSLSKGSENSEVLKLQQFLFDSGYLTAKPNGYFGGLTVTAVKKFQGANGLSQVGSVGVDTRGKVKEVSCKNATVIDTKSTIKFASLGVTESDLQTALVAAKKVEDEFRASASPQIKLNPEQQKGIQKEVASIMATRILLSGSDSLVADTQQPGKQVVIKSALVKSRGFIVIKNLDYDHTSKNKEILGISKLLPVGTAKNISILLNEYVDGVELSANLYKDDGDGVFEPTKDKNVIDVTNAPIYKTFSVSTRRDPQNVYYSNYLTKGSPALLLKEQLPGNKISFESITMPYDPKNFEKSFFIAIFKDLNGLPGKLIGSGIRKGYGGNDISLTESVSNEMLYAMMFEDNGDSKFDMKSDSVIRGENNLPIIIKFKVIK